MYVLISHNIDFTTYSTTREIECGTWVDGKTLYKKTVHYGALPNSTEKAVPHNISDINYIVKIEGIASRSSDSIFFQIGNVPFPSASLAVSINITANANNITIATGIDRSNMDAYVTLYYTKSS